MKRRRLIGPLEIARRGLRDVERCVASQRSQLVYHTAAIEYHRIEARWVREGLKANLASLKYQRDQVRREQSKKVRRRRSRREEVAS